MNTTTTTTKNANSETMYFLLFYNSEEGRWIS
jgi:hypothetical protein